MAGAEQSDRLALAALIAAGVVASLGSGLAPFMVGALVDFAGLSVSQAGAVAAAEMTGAMSGSLAIFFLVNRLERRALILSGALLFAAGNLAAAFVGSFASFLAIRALCGLSSAIVVATVAASLATRQGAERAYGLYFLAMIVSGALASLVIPAIIAAAGAAGLFLALAGTSLLAIAGAFLLPRPRATVAQRAISTGLALDARQLQALACMFLWFVAFGATWTFIERLGAGIPLTAAAVGLALAVSMGGGASGALAASVVGGRIGASRPIALAAVACALAGALLPASNSLLTFTAAALVYQFGFALAMPYISAVLASIDRSGRLMTLGTLMQAAGLAAGPGIGSALVTAQTVAPAIYFSVTAGIFAAVLAVRLAHCAGESLMRPAAIAAVEGARRG